MFDLSVIIPTCERLVLLNRVVSSILSQGLDSSNFEIVIIDDSQEDLTLEIEKVFIGLPLLNVQVIRNNGIHSAARARNLGVTAAKGEYITFVDDDDVLLPRRLINLLEFAKINPQYSLISSGRLYEKNNFESLTTTANQLFGVVYLKDIYIKNDIDIGFIIKKEMFLQLGGFDVEFSAFEDWDFVIRALLIKPAYKIKRYDYAVNDSGARPRVSSGELLAYSQLINKHKDSFDKKWFYILTALDSANRNEMNVFSSMYYVFKTKSIRPFRFYLSSKFKNIRSIFLKPL